YWATGAGGAGPDYGYGIITDGLDNVYVTGRFGVTATFGSFTLTSAGGQHAFVAKVGPAIYVDDDYTLATPGWQVDHFDVVQDAIDASANGDTIIVYPGTYAENINFNGKAILLTGSDPGNWDTVASIIIDGGALGPVVTFNTGETSASVIKGLTIQNGSATSGGGIYCNGSSPTIMGNIVRDNVASPGEGGGISCRNSSATVFGNVVGGNQSAGNGGGVYCDNASPNIDSNIIFSNTTSSNGGGICGGSISGAILNNIVSGNSANNDMGGIFCAGGTPT
ncbi:unnamed protein product, partial [marine sediment metagenome]